MAAGKAADVSEAEVMKFIQVLRDMGIYDSIASNLRTVFGIVDVGEIRRVSRREPIASGRAFVMYYLRDRFGWSYTAIGRLLGRDHTSVIPAIARYKRNIRRVGRERGAP